MINIALAAKSKAKVKCAGKPQFKQCASQYTGWTGGSYGGEYGGITIPRDGKFAGIADDDDEYFLPSFYGVCSY